MSRLPVIVGFGGFNAAGRSSFHHGYRRTVIESLSKELRQETLVGLATLMKLVSYGESGYVDPHGMSYTAAEVVTKFGEQILNSTLIRRIELFDDTKVHTHQKVELSHFSFCMAAKQLPHPLPISWTVVPIGGAGSDKVQVTVATTFNGLVDSTRDLPVKSAGQLPTGFDPADHYSSRSHPRGLQMAVTASSDAVHSIGINWATIANAVHPDEIGVFAASGMSQLDENGNGEMMQARLKGERVCFGQRRNHWGRDRCLREFPLQLAPRGRRHSRRQTPCRGSRLHRGASGPGSDRRLCDHGRVGHSRKFTQAGQRDRM